MTDPVSVSLCQVVPSAPGRVLASRNTKTSVVVQWDQPKHGEDLLGYYVDCCVAGSNVWEPCNHKPIGYNRCCCLGPSPPTPRPMPLLPSEVQEPQPMGPTGAGAREGHLCGLHHESVSSPVHEGCVLYSW